MHSSRMCTTRCSGWEGGVYAQGVSVGGMSAQGVFAAGCLPGGCLHRDVCPGGGVCPWGLCPWGCLPRGGVFPGGVCLVGVSKHENITFLQLLLWAVIEVFNLEILWFNMPTKALISWMRMVGGYVSVQIVNTGRHTQRFCLSVCLCVCVCGDPMTR